MVVEVIKEEAPVNGDKPKGGQGKNYIQVGAFKTNAAAVSLSKNLVLCCRNRFCSSTSPLQQSDLHKVWVGPLTEEKQKLYVLEIISDNGFEGPLYIKE